MPAAAVTAARDAVAASRRAEDEDERIVGTDEVAGPSHHHPDPRSPWGPRARWQQFSLAGAAYLVLAAVLWWRVWTTHPTSVMTCGCVDAGREVWYFEWFAYALAHGHNPLFSQWMLYPRGVDVVADTSVPLIGIVLSPVTLIFGPVASMNLASTLAPVLAAFSMFWLLRRWTRSPAAFVGGLAYGFSSFVVVQLTFGWLNLSFLALVPLMVGCLDELLVRQRRRPAAVGATLGLLIALQFFVSNELLLLVAMAGVVGVVLLVGYAVGRGVDDLGHRVGHALRGLGVALGVAVGLLAYPVWYFVAGPAHLGTAVWGVDAAGNLGNSPANFWTNVTTWGPLNAKGLAAEMHAIGGYQGAPLPSAAFLGWGMIAVLGVGTVVWRRDKRLWFWGALGLILAAFSLRTVGNRWAPWALIDHVSLLNSVWQSRFSSVIDLCAAVMLAVVIDRTWSATRSWTAVRSAGPSRWLASGVTVAVAVVALAPVAAGIAPNVPITVEAVAVPQWFTLVAPHLRTGQVPLTYPTSSYNSQTPLVWQAVDRLSFRMVGGGGPAATAARAGQDRAGYDVLDSASVVTRPPPAITPQALADVHRALRDWGVSMVVVPDQSQLPAYLRGRSNAFAIALFTAVLGVTPQEQDHAWVWERVRDDPGPLSVSAATFARCTAEPATGSQAASCIAAGAESASGRPSHHAVTDDHL